MQALQIRNSKFNIYITRRCSKCHEDTTYYCESCPCDLCPNCKENHVIDLKTTDHNVRLYREKTNYISTQEIYVKHLSHVDINYCELCKLRFSDSCSEDPCTIRNSRAGQGNKSFLNLQEAYKTKRLQHRGTIHTIRNEALFYRRVLLSRIKADFETCHKEFSHYQSDMLLKAQKLKDSIDYIQTDFICHVFSDFDFQHRCLKQEIEMMGYIFSLQRYVRRYEQSTIRPIQFLSSIKTTLFQIHLTLHTSQVSIASSLNKKDMMKSLSAI